MSTRNDAPVKNVISVPEGTYLCRVGEVRPGITRAGDERWSFSLLVDEGEYAGRCAAWGNIVFARRGRVHARSVLSACGHPKQVTGRITIEPEDMVGSRLLATVRPGGYERSDGVVVRCNEITYYAAAPR